MDEIRRQKKDFDREIKPESYERRASSRRYTDDLISEMLLLDKLEEDETKLNIKKDKRGYEVISPKKISAWNKRSTSDTVKKVLWDISDKMTTSHQPEITVELGGSESEEEEWKFEDVFEDDNLEDPPILARQRAIFDEPTGNKSGSPVPSRKYLEPDLENPQPSEQPSVNVKGGLNSAEVLDEEGQEHQTHLHRYRKKGRSKNKLSGTDIVIQNSDKPGGVVLLKHTQYTSSDHNSLNGENATSDHNGLRHHNGQDYRTHMPALSRRKISSHINGANEKNGDEKRDGQMVPPAQRKSSNTLDRHPHKLFVEMDEYLKDEYGSSGWKETARWIKFEEDLEESTSRWGKPHVPILSFHGLAELRRRLETGTIIFDMDETEYELIMKKIVLELRENGQITENQFEPLIHCLTKPHKHTRKKSVVGEPKRSLGLINKFSMPKIGLNSSDPNLNNVVGADIGKSNANFAMDEEPPKTDNNAVAINMVNHGPNTSNAAKRINSTAPPPSQRGSDLGVHFLEPLPRKGLFSRAIQFFSPKRGAGPGIDHKISSPSSPPTNASFNLTAGAGDWDHKIPGDTEAALVLVGGATLFDPDTHKTEAAGGSENEGVTVLVRLARAVPFPPSTLEVEEIPVRFLFILLGPTSLAPPLIPTLGLLGGGGGSWGEREMNYRELGRSFATLMSNEIFNKIAYKAQSCRDITSGFNHFLKNSIVLPPGEFGRSTLMPITNLYREQLIKKQAQKDHQAWGKDKGLALGKKLKKTGGNGDDDIFKYRGQVFGGLISDIKRKMPFYLNDYTTAFNLQCCSAFVFIYFACLSPCITFGGILSSKTNNWMGVSEIMISTCLGGCIFALLAGQPLAIIGATGPIIIFEDSLYKFCTQNNINYMAFRIWVAMWVCLITIIFVAVEGTCLIRYLTRYTQEIFSILISLIYIYETFANLFFMFQRFPLLPDYCHLNITIEPPRSQGTRASEFFAFFFPRRSSTTGIPSEDLNRFKVPVKTANISSSGNATFGSDYTYKIPYHELKFPSDYSLVELGSDQHLKFERYVAVFNIIRPNTALFCTLLVFGTFFIAYFLKVFRNSKFFGRNARRALADFGVPIAIIIMIAVAYTLGKNVYVPKLNVPSTFTTTAPERRGWFINPLLGPVGFPTHNRILVWQIFVALFPAIMIFTLLFLEGMITCLIVNRKDRKFIKGPGYNLDILLLGSLPLLMAFLGLPWVSGATVRSWAHVSSLTVFSRTHAPGEPPAVIGVLEQRMTGFLVSLAIGLSMFCSKYLQMIPTAILFGIFLYLGISSLKGIQFFDRLTLILMPLKHYPTVSYVRKVGLFKLHIFTLIQLSCLIALWCVRLTVAAQAFPFVLIIYILIRFQLKWFYSPQELHELDKEDIDDKSDDDIDINEEVHMPI